MDKITNELTWDKGAFVEETKDILNTRESTYERVLKGDERNRQPGKLYEAENLMTTGLIITEPITWSRLKVVYSFEYDGTLR